MKIAIKVNPTRGKEIIKILSDLGGRSSCYNGNGTIKHYCYFIDEKNHNRIEYDIPPTNYKIYTLEEFEKEFPFKIGDKVIYDYTPNFVGTVVNIKFDDNIPYRVNINGTICTYGTIMLKPYKEMNTRNIKLTLEKAKEWYKKGGELKEIALQAFTEKELNSLPRSWEEFSWKYKICSTRYAMPSKYVALYQLEQLRNCWWNGWKPNWLEGNVQKYVIQKWRDRISIETTYVTHSFLSFPTYELAKDFLECFGDLIEKAGDLI